jgi:hypothetical protein
MNAQEIGKSNAAAAIDIQTGSERYPTDEEAQQSYRQNAIDTAVEYGVDPDETACAFDRALNNKGVQKMRNRPYTYSQDGIDYDGVVAVSQLHGLKAIMIAREAVALAYGIGKMVWIEEDAPLAAWSAAYDMAQGR